jgi:hypothetical protein
VIRNTSGAPLFIPAPDSFPEKQRRPWRGYHAQPLYPILTTVKGPRCRAACRRRVEPDRDGTGLGVLRGRE